MLKRYFGEVDSQSQEIPFTYTDYYEREIGNNLKRVFVSFKRLIPPSELAKIKNITNRIEDRLAKENKRTVNIDPGYVDLAKLVLASTKDYKHRIYLNKGIFAEITLVFQDKSFKAWECTYPDYAGQDYIGIFNKIRDIYNIQIKQIRK